MLYTNQLPFWFSSLFVLFVLSELSLSQTFLYSLILLFSLLFLCLGNCKHIQVALFVFL